jgi:hypothetical protein
MLDTLSKYTSISSELWMPADVICLLLSNLVARPHVQKLWITDFDLTAGDCTCR